MGAALLMHFARLLVDRGKAEEALAMSDQSLKNLDFTSPERNPSTGASSRDSCLYAGAPWQTARSG